MKDIVALSSGTRGAVETVGLAPPASVVIESDGSVEGVDTLRSVEEGESWLGLDVFSDSFEAAIHRPKLLHRQESWTAVLSEECQRCPLVAVCGGYLPHRFSATRGYRNP